jgi:hypothetical protein
MWATFKISTEFGIIPYLSNTVIGSAFVGANMSGMMTIGTDEWDCRSGDSIRKNNGAVTISGGATPHFGQLGHDPTAAYLLVLTSTTAIKRYSGIAGATITYVDTITLDTAISSTRGFIFDDTNNRYIAIDTVNGVIRRFNSAGATIDTLAYTLDITSIIGLTMVNDRVYFCAATGTGSYDNSGAASPQTIVADLIPTTMTR